MAMAMDHKSSNVHAWLPSMKVTVKKFCAMSKRSFLRKGTENAVVALQFSSRQTFLFFEQIVYLINL